MFINLLGRECRQVLKSTTYYIYVIILVLFFFSQMGEVNMPTKPVPGQESYGFREGENENDIMRATLGKLAGDWDRNEYVTYPIGFYKMVSLNDEDKEEVAKILSKATGKSKEQIEKLVQKPNSSPNKSAGIITGEAVILEPSKEMTYTHFIQLMDQVDQMLGGNSSSAYAPEKLKENVRVPNTYEESLQEYEDILNLDHISNAQARLFSDYMVIIASLLPVFLAVTRGLRDRRSKAEGVLYSKQASAVSMIGSRYLSTVILGILPILILGISPALESMYLGKSMGIEADLLAFPAHILGWILPSMLISLSVGFFFTELTDSAFGILVQGIWWFIDINAATAGGLTGNFGLHLIPRWNTVGESVSFAEQLPILVTNRMVYVIAALILAAATVLLYHLKRKGIWTFHGRIFRNRKSESEV